ncbi:MAG: hypothetical protein SVU32_01410 [Candidatus Nanohaloarchaea archaeon]|nr:hypothetical protein [Candidatus Nanohaloarchaea archaeon]
MSEFDECAICGSENGENATTVGELEVCGAECARTAWLAKEIFDLREEVAALRKGL